MFVVRALEVAILVDRAAEGTRQRQPADGPAMEHLEGVDRRSVDPKPRRRRFRTWSFVTKRLQQASHTPTILGGPEQHGDTKIVAGFALQVGEDGAGLRHLVHQ